MLKYCARFILPPSRAASQSAASEDLSRLRERSWGSVDTHLELRERAPAAVPRRAAVFRRGETLWGGSAP